MLDVGEQPVTGGGRTLFDRIWDDHVIAVRDGQSLLHVDRHYIHDGSAQSFERLDFEGVGMRSAGGTIGTADHYVPTRGGAAALVDPDIKRMVESLARNSDRFGIEHFGLGHPRQGIVHVIGPELGLTLPGSLVVCGDSHTSTHGALGAFAFGIGASEEAHVLATRTLWQSRPKTMRISVDGSLPPGTTAKDLILHIIGAIGTDGGTGHVIEYAGRTVAELSIEGRLTLCNMSIEAGARAGMVAPDEKALAYIAGRPYAPTGKAWERALRYWRDLKSDADATFDREIAFDGPAVAPTVTWGTSPEDAVPITAAVPDPDSAPTSERRRRHRQALDYMGLVAGTPMAQIVIDRVFIGSCANSRIEDLREAAATIKGRRAVVPVMVVPGSGTVKAQAEAEGLHRVFIDAGCEWRDPGCSMCVGFNGADLIAPGERCASTSNRNFEGRQGPGARTHLMSPAMAAAAAITGRMSDVRQFLSRGPGSSR
jgi:3-isopropylmalate/(R)-2-methylmalate dehydratase large subunit